MKNTHIVVVSKTFPPAAVAESHVTAKVVHGLLQSGAQVTVVTSTEWGDSHTALEKRMMHPNLRVLRTRVIESAARIPIHLACALRLRLPIGPAHFVWSGRRLFDQIERPPDLIYARGLPSHAYFLGARLSHDYRVPLILHIADPWPKRNMPPPYSKTRDAAELWEEWASNGPLLAAAAFTVPGERLSRYLRARLPAMASKPVHVLPHPVAPWEPVAVPGFPGDRTTGRMELVHAGRLDNQRDPSNFLLGLRQFLDAHPHAIRLTLIGAGWTPLPQLIESLRLSGDVILMETMEYLQTLSALRSADVLLLLEAVLSEGIFLPSKFADYCWAARPIFAVTQQNSEVADYLNKIAIPITPANSSPEHFARALESLHQQWMAGTLRDASTLCAEFDLTRLTDRLLSIMDAVT